MRLMSIDRLACLRKYSLLGNKQRKKDAANVSSLMFRNVSAIFKTKSGEPEHAWKDELLVVVGYNLEVFAIVWGTHCKGLFVKGFDDQ